MKLPVAFPLDRLGQEIKLGSIIAYSTWEGHTNYAVVESMHLSRIYSSLHQVSLTVIPVKPDGSKAGNRRRLHNIHRMIVLDEAVNATKQIRSKIQEWLSWY